MRRYVTERQQEEKESDEHEERRLPFDGERSAERERMRIDCVRKRQDDGRRRDLQPQSTGVVAEAAYGTESDQRQRLSEVSIHARP